MSATLRVHQQLTHIHYDLQTLVIKVGHINWLDTYR